MPYPNPEVASMHGLALALVLFSAILHATWNAQLKGGDKAESGSDHDRPQFMASMSLVVGLIALCCAPFVPLPTQASWICIAISAVLHIVYNLLLLQNYKLSDFSSTYPIARGVSPLLVTLGAFFLMRQQPNVYTIVGVLLISAGIVFLSTGKGKISTFATCSALATGAVIAAYTVVDGMGVQRSKNTLSYTVWVFASYLLMPAVMRALRFPVRVRHTDSIPRAASAGVCSLVAYTIVLWATHYAPVGIVSALRETSVLWAIVIGRVFLGEAFTWRRTASASLICSGVFLLVAMSR
jgi:drug/metabolite transporter (DMT)-like permease